MANALIGVRRVHGLRADEGTRAAGNVDHGPCYLTTHTFGSPKVQQNLKENMWQGVSPSSNWSLVSPRC